MCSNTAWSWVNHRSAALAAQTMGRAGSKPGQTWGRGSTIGTHRTSFMAQCHAGETVALLGHIPHPARQESPRPHTPPHLPASPALCPATATGSPVVASCLSASPLSSSCSWQAAQVLLALVTMIIFVFPARRGSPLALLLPGPKPGGTQRRVRGAGNILRCQGRGPRWDAGDGAEDRRDPVPPLKGSDWKSTPAWLIH